MTQHLLNNPFWQYSLKLYRQEGVEECCLQLQQQGVDVNVLLFACWLAAIGERWQFQDAQEALQITKNWRDSVVKPLRNLRQTLPKISQFAEFREKVKTLELDAEQFQQAQLYSFHQSLSLPAIAVNEAALQHNLMKLAEALEADFSQVSDNVLTTEQVMDLGQSSGDSHKGSVNMSQERMPALFVHFSNATFTN